MKTKMLMCFFYILEMLVLVRADIEKAQFDKVESRERFKLIEKKQSCFS